MDKLQEVYKELNEALKNLDNACNLLIDQGYLLTTEE